MHIHPCALSMSEWSALWMPLRSEYCQLRREQQLEGMPACLSEEPICPRASPVGLSSQDPGMLPLMGHSASAAPQSAMLAAHFHCPVLLLARVGQMVCAQLLAPPAVARVPLDEARTAPADEQQDSRAATRQQEVDHLLLPVLLPHSSLLHAHCLVTHWRVDDEEA